MTKYIGAQKLSVHQQAARIRRLWPFFKVTTSRRGLIARGTVRPTPLTRLYEVRIECIDGQMPKIYVEKPPLGRRPQAPLAPIPHTYDSACEGRERPCVYYPGADWDATKPIATTIIPWFMCWLVDYELWRATGEWHGGGAAHIGAKNESVSR